jgi:D-arabinose 1-dehydrogenase-like Zn-dependent alcohol dehydrogenase
VRALRVLSKGWETLCPEQKNSGYSMNGSFAEYALGQADYLGQIPDRFPSSVLDRFCAQAHDI